MNELMMLKASPFDCFANAILDPRFNKWFTVFITIVVVMMIFDILTGYLKAFVTKEVSSKIGSKGLAKKIANVTAFLFGAFVDICAIVFSGSFLNILRIDCSFMCVIGGYITCNECISIVENLSKISPNMFPKWVTKFFKEVKSNIDNLGEKPKK